MQNKSSNMLMEETELSLMQHEAFWVDQLSEVVEMKFPLYTGFAQKPENSQSSSLTIKLSSIEINLLQQNYGEIAPTCHILSTLLLAYFYRLSNYGKISVKLYHSGVFNIIKNNDSPFSKYLPLNINFEPEMQFSSALKLVNTKIDQLLSQKTFAKNLKLKYPQLQNHVDPNSIPIAINIVDNFSHFEPNPNNLIDAVISSNGKKLIIFYDSNIHFINSMKLLLHFMHEHITNLLHSILKCPEKTLSELTFLAKKEEKLMIKTWNNTKAVFPSTKTIDYLFNAATKKIPDNIAIQYLDQSMTYEELDLRSNHLANYLVNQGVKKGKFVAICTERNPLFIIGVLGILKAGAGYVPIDPAYPEERIRYIIQDSKSHLLLTQKTISSYLLKCAYNDMSADNELIAPQIICLDAWQHNQEKTLKFRANIKATDIAYIIYTSGTTSRPKGVMVTHRNVINYANWFANIFCVTELSKIDFSSSIAFDLSVACVIVPLLYNATVVICPHETKYDPLAYLNYLQEYKITHIESTPGYFRALLDYPHEIKQLAVLKWIMLGADAVLKKDVEHWLSINPSQIIPNEYGPTECTVAVTAHLTSAENINDYVDCVPIGKPAFNNKVYVLDLFGNHCPIGIPGELYIAGDNVALGYLNLPELTQQKFHKRAISNSTKKELLYKTGDMVRWLSDGSLEFIGRNDSQVKIRGYRVELKEIEDAILKYKSIRQCAVIALNTASDEKVLVAYVALEEEKSFEKNLMKAFLRLYLPEYMIPAHYVFLDKLPLNTNDKVDRSLLPKFNTANEIADEENDENSENEEEILTKIWKDILGLHSINLNDSFFEIGGHSLAALKIISSINSRFSSKITLNQLFNKPTISELAKLIHAEKHTEASNVEYVMNKQAPLILLQPFGFKKPFFFIHPVGGTVFWYKQLARYLRKNHPLYAIQDPGIDTGQFHFNSIEEMAANYLKAIKSIQPHGSYLLAGASFGATVAVEIARQLKEKGESAEFVALLDGWAIYPEKLMDENFFDQLMREQYNHTLVQFKAQGIDNAEALLKLQWQREKLLFEYHMPVIENKLTLFKSDELWPIFKSIDSPYNWWDKYAMHPIEVFKIPGNHETMFWETNVQTLASCINKCLLRIDKVNHDTNEFEETMV